MEQDGRTTTVPPLKEVTITVVHDNYPYVDSLQTAWGFSAHVLAAGKSILFDTGSDGPLLLENLARLQIDPGDIEILVLSHVHGDHTGGLTGLLRVNPRIRVYLPESFPDRMKDITRRYGAGVVEVREPTEICPNVYTTGILGRRTKEQAMVVHTRRGLVMLTGCAHPGIGKMVTEVRRLYADDILLVMGGFHLEWAVLGKLERTIATFQDQGVRCVAPTHCSGEKARQQFEKRYGHRFIEVGVGKTITLTDLP